MTQSKVAILIVAYHSRQVVGDCVTAARRTGATVTVIDNGSGDGAAEAAAERGARVISNPTNRGFAAAVNQGVRETTEPFLLLLNPDVILLTGIDPLVDACEQGRVGAAGGRLVGMDGRPQKGFTVRRFPTPAALLCEVLLVNRLWPGNPVNWRYRCLGQDLTCASEVEQPAGAFLLFRREVWEQIGGFDEGYFPIWFEDVDFCKRIRGSGYGVMYRPEAVGRHQGAHSIESLALGTKTEYWYRSLLRYSITNFHGLGKILICLGVIAGCALRFLLGGRSHRSPAMRAAYRSVVRLAFRSIWHAKPRFGEALS